MLSNRQQNILIGVFVLVLFTIVFSGISWIRQGVREEHRRTLELGRSNPCQDPPQQYRLRLYPSGNAASGMLLEVAHRRAEELIWRDTAYQCTRYRRNLLGQ